MDLTSPAADAPHLDRFLLPTVARGPYTSPRGTDPARAPAHHLEFFSAELGATDKLGRYVDPLRDDRLLSGRRVARTL